LTDVGVDLTEIVCVHKFGRHNSLIIFGNYKFLKGRTFKNMMKIKKETENK